MLIFEAQIEEGGVIHLPDSIAAQLSAGTTVRVSLALPDDHILTDEDIATMNHEELWNEGEGRTAEEIAKSPYIGAWADRDDIGDSAEYIAEMRRKSRKNYSW